MICGFYNISTPSHFWYTGKLLDIVLVSMFCFAFYSCTPTYTHMARPADRGTVDSATVKTILPPLPVVLAGSLWFPYILSLILIIGFSNFKFRTFYHFLPFLSTGFFPPIFSTPFLSFCCLASRPPCLPYGATCVE